MAKIKILDHDGERGLLDGKGNPLPAGAEPVWLEFELYDWPCNSAGRPFDVPAGTRPFGTPVEADTPAIVPAQGVGGANRTGGGA